MFQHGRSVKQRSPAPPRRAFGNLVELARCRAEEQPLKKAFVYLRDGEVESDSLTFASLDAGARAMAAALQQHFQPGDRVLLSHRSGLEFIVAFFGCLYAGVLAVPVYPPTASTEIGRLERIAADCDARGICLSPSGFDGTRAAVASSPSLRRLACITLPAVLEQGAGDWVSFQPSADSLALLQYTSGSTGAPKGVMVSHGNVLHNQRLIEEAFGVTERSLAVCWLPLFHDMGLIGHVLQSLYLGSTTVLMSPVAFVSKPARWLQAISDHRATSSGGPDFAYDLCVRRITPQQMIGLDLSCWNVAFSGAETVRHDTLARFAEKFEGCGFRRSALAPCYGMAEATLFVSASGRSRLPAVCRVDSTALQEHRVEMAEADDPKALAVVSCGRAVEQKLAIVDPQTCSRCSAGRVGEIWVQGASVARGYWNNPVGTAATFGARIAGSDAGPYLRTGDMGFINGGELFITGRIKDLIVIGGRNYYPSYIEAAVSASHPALEGGLAAAFSVELEGEERLIVVHEIHRHLLRRLRPAEVMGAARAAVWTQLGLPLQDLVLLAQGSLPKTSSGKIRRRASREAYLSAPISS